MQNNLTDRREDEGLSQGELAEALGVTRQTINAIERNRYDPSLELAFKLADHFDCRIEEIFEPDQDE
jgi:putative transcriptional regulator